MALTAKQELEQLIAEMTPERVINAWLFNEDVVLPEAQYAALIDLVEKYAILRGGTPIERAIEGGHQ